MVAALVEGTVEADDAGAVDGLGGAAADCVVVDRTAAEAWLGVEELVVVPHAAASIPTTSDAAPEPSLRERTLLVVRRIILRTLRPVD